MKSLIRSCWIWNRCGWLGLSHCQKGDVEVSYLGPLVHRCFQGYRDYSWRDINLSIDCGISFPLFVDAYDPRPRSINVSFFPLIWEEKATFLGVAANLQDKGTGMISWILHHQNTSVERTGMFHPVEEDSMHRSSEFDVLSQPCPATLMQASCHRSRHMSEVNYYVKHLVQDWSRWKTYCFFEDLRMKSGDRCLNETRMYNMFVELDFHSNFISLKSLLFYF